MFKKLLAIFTLVVVVGFVSTSFDLFMPGRGLVTAQEGKCACKRGCDCDHCMGKSSTCPCGTKTKEQPAKCEKCGHEKCPTDCNRCPDCLIKKQEEQRKKSGY